VNNNILLITPPDKIHNQNKNILLVHPSSYIKNYTQEFLAESDEGFNVYIYEPQSDEEYDLDWLLGVARFAEVSIIDVDNCDPQTRQIASYLVSLPTVYWLTSGEDTCYSKLSVNRTYDLEILNRLKGGNFEK
jgi:hypothetical protein